MVKNFVFWLRAAAQLQQMFPGIYSLVPRPSLCLVIDQSEHASVVGHSLIPGPKRTGNEVRWEGMGAVVGSIDATLQNVQNKKGPLVCLIPPELIFNNFFFLHSSNMATL